MLYDLLVRQSLCFRAKVSQAQERTRTCCCLLGGLLSQGKGFPKPDSACHRKVIAQLQLKCSNASPAKNFS